MEIVYDGAGNLTIRFDNGRELRLDEILNLDKCLTLTRNSREWNRKRVVELEGMLERGGAVDDATSTELVPGERLYTAAEVGDLQASEAELVAAPLRRQVAELEAKVRGYDEDRHTERDRADRLQRELARRVAELERSLGLSVDRENRLVTERAERVAEHRQSIAARDRLLESATRRIGAARDFLTAPTVAEARENIVTSQGAVLADAIGNTLSVLDTSQA